MFHWTWSDPDVVFILGYGPTDLKRHFPTRLRSEQSLIKKFFF